MEVIQIKRFDGGMDDVAVFTKDYFPFDLLDTKAIKCKHKKLEYCYTFGAFDIETTTITEPDKTPYGFMYIWQMCIGGYVCIGRTWMEWVEFVQALMEHLNVSPTRHLVIYVHNLQFEFQHCRDFLDKYFGGFKVFAIAQRKPIHVNTPTGLEFRCSYKLTNMSLAKALENEKGVVHCKAEHDLDYRVRRTPSTYLSPTELGYCISDVVGLYELIQRRMINDHDNLESIPMTSTGYVRRDCRNASRKDKKYRQYFKSMELTETVYTMLREESRGGDTHANRFLANQIIEDIDSYDVKSSYPFQMFQRFPMSKFTPYGDIESMDEFNNLLANYACLFHVVFVNLRCKETTEMPYIPISKLLQYDHSSLVNDNGRCLQTAYARLTLIDIDWTIIKDTYTWDSCAISDMHIAKWGYLPQCLLDQVIKYFRIKSELQEEIEEKEEAEIDASNEKYLYAKSKNKLNAIFGMMYQDPVRSNISIDESTGEWKEEKADVASALKKYFSSRNSFLVYSHGCYITAWARLHLHRMRSACGHTIYSDTDSAKCIEADYEGIEKMNTEIMAYAEERGCYVDVKGKRFYLGYYEKENKQPIQRFKTLGAKKYVYEDEKGLHVTISGVDKEKGAEELRTIDNFAPGFIFKEAGGLTLYYNDDLSIHTINVDGEEILTASNIGMVDSTYTIGLTKEYAELIGMNILAMVYD